ncbi:MAG: dUTP diphosphatase [Spongiibacteraceae bacterium]|nr:dUTP diphosphatase [Spongiibacteraceae bacterium]
MRQALTTMLTLQDRMNTRVHPEWIDQQFAWYRAVWIECGELIEHYGYKWWKKQEPDLAQVRLEVVDIWHFGMSALFRPGKAVELIAAEIEAELADWRYQGQDVREATEALAAFALSHRAFSVSAFWELLTAVELDFATLHRQYVGKNVLNFFRQDHGYKSGEYRKLWAGREDNEHLVELLAELDSNRADFPDALYAALTDRYQQTAG